MSTFTHEINLEPGQTAIVHTPYGRTLVWCRLNSFGGEKHITTIEPAEGATLDIRDNRDTNECVTVMAMVAKTEAQS